MPNHRPVISIHPTTGEEREWRNMTQCALEIGCHVGDLSRQLKANRGAETDVKGWKVREKHPRVDGPTRDRASTADQHATRKAPKEPEPERHTEVKIPEELKPFAGDANQIRTVAEAKDYLRRKLLELSTTIDLVASGVKELPRGMDPKKILDVYKAIAESWGVDWKHLGDTRSDAEKNQDSADKICGLPHEMLSLLDDELVALEHAFDTSLRHAKNYLDKYLRQERGEPEPPELAGGKARAEALDCWLKRIRRVKNLRRLAKSPNPEKTDSAVMRIAWAGTQVLRYQAYVGRSDMKCRPAFSGPASTVFVFGKLHAKLAVDMYLAENKIGVTPKGLLGPGDKYNAGEKKKVTATYPGVNYTGIIAMFPPRHGKTAQLRHWAALKISTNPRTQGAYTHAVDQQASGFLRNVASLFTSDNASGRRNLSLFPHLRLAAYDNNASKLRLFNEEPPKCPNLFAAGISSAVQGINLDWLIGDDLVPREDIDQPTERERRKQQFMGTWVSRIQGNGFTVISGYPWHFDDLVWTTKLEAEKAVETKGREGAMLKLSHWAVGGPTTEPKYKSIFPEMYPPQKLRSIYRTTTPEIWSANWMLQPITDELRIVRKIELFDERPETDPYEHARFMDRAEVHLSLDPSFAGKEQSDKAGIVMVAIGDLEHHAETRSGSRTTLRTVIRVIHAEEVRATQPELAAIVSEMAKRRRIDRCHVELTGGSYAMRPFLESFHGIQSVIEHPVRNRSKEQRLRLVASMLEASSPEIRPVVQFPGVKDERGVVVLNKRYQKLHDYIVNHRATTGHHSLDALTQVLNYLAPRVGIGEGDVSKEAIRHAKDNWQRQAKRSIIAECRIPSKKEAWMPDTKILEYASGGVA